MNTWPENKKQALSQDEHKKWNSKNYPGTLQICCKCEEPTGNCEEDGLFDDDGNSYCHDCAVGSGLIENDCAN